MPHARNSSCITRFRVVVRTACVLSLLAFLPAKDAFAQGAEWANANASETDADASTASARTPIERDHSTSAERSAQGDARPASWSWAWLPIAIASVLWWIVGRLRRRGPYDAGLLPEGVVVPLGRQTIGSGQSVQLIRIGSRILVVTPTAEGLRTLSEISDPQEVERLVSLCLRPQQGMGSISGLFTGRPIRQVEGASSARSQVVQRTNATRPSPAAVEPTEVAR